MLAQRQPAAFEELRKATPEADSYGGEGYDVELHVDVMKPLAVILAGYLAQHTPEDEVLAKELAHRAPQRQRLPCNLRPQLRSPLIAARWRHKNGLEQRALVALIMAPVTSRLYIAAALLPRMRGVRCLVFVKTREEVEQRFLRILLPERIRWKLAEHYM